MELVNSLPLLKRRLIWDIIPCDKVPEYLPTFGLVPASQDVSEMEHKESHRRIDGIAPIIQALDLLSCEAGMVAKEGILLSQGRDVTSRDREILRAQSVIDIAVVRSVVANLLESGLIHLGGSA